MVENTQQITRYSIYQINKAWEKIAENLASVLQPSGINITAVLESVSQREIEVSYTFEKFAGTFTAGTEAVMYNAQQVKNAFLALVSGYLLVWTSPLVPNWKDLFDTLPADHNHTSVSCPVLNSNYLTFIIKTRWFPNTPVWCRYIVTPHQQALMYIEIGANDNVIKVSVGTGLPWLTYENILKHVDAEMSKRYTQVVSFSDRNVYINDGIAVETYKTLVDLIHKDETND